MSWDQRFDRPVVLPDGKTLRTLEDAVAANVSETEIEKRIIRPLDRGSR